MHRLFTSLRLSTRAPAAIGLLAAGLFVAACGENPGATCAEGDGCLFRIDRAVVGVTTSVSSAQIFAGSTVDVRCTVRFDDGVEELITEDVSVEVSPAPNATIEGLRVSLGVAGDYAVTCKTPLHPDPTTEIVSVVGGEPVRVRVELAAPTVAAGETVAAQCIVEDAFGNLLPDVPARLRSSPSRGVDVQPGQVRGELVGRYEISCNPSPLRIESTAVDLEVVPGRPTSIIAELSQYAVPVDTHVDVTCRMVDALGNPVTGPTEFSVTPAPDTIDATGFSSTVAGPFNVVCTQPTEAIDSEPVLCTVQPGLPSSLTIVDLAPQKAIYARVDTIDLTVDIRDQYGNAVPAADWEIVGLPAGSVIDIGAGRATLTGDGEIDVIAQVTSATQGRLPVRDSRSIIVDGTAPEVVITYPTRAALVAGAPGRPITIRGRVTDATSQVAELTINGQRVSISGTGSFNTTMSPEWGLNLIEVIAADTAGNRGDVISGFSYASEYRRAGPNRTTSGRIADGVIAHLGRAALDDNNADVDDMATIARLAIENADIAALIPDPATTYNSDCSIPFVSIRGALRLYVDDVTFGRPDIGITPINGGLRLSVSIPNLNVDMRTRGDVCNIGVNLNGSARADRVVITGDILVSNSGGNMSVRMPNATVDVRGLRIDLDLPGIIDWAVDGIINLFSGAITRRLESAFSNVIRTQVPAVVDGFLGGVGLETGFNLPQPIGTRININTGLGMLSFSSRGGDVGLDTTAYARGVITPEPRGGILRETQTIPTFSATHSFAVALGYDLVNQALYSLFYAGGLNMDLDEQFLPEDFNNNGQMLQLDATLTAHGAPVMRPTGNAQWPVELQVADLEIALDIDGLQGLPPIQATVFAAAFIRANVTINRAGEIGLALDPAPRVKLDFTTPLDGFIDMPTLTRSLEDAVAGVVPQIVGQLLTNFPLPNIDLSSLAGGFLPPNIVLGLGNASTRFHPSYLILEGRIVRIP